MSIFDNIGNAPNALPNARSALQRIMSDPVGVLRQRGLSIPTGMTNPQQIINHLVQSGQVPQNRLTQAMQMLGGMRR